MFKSNSITDVSTENPRKRSLLQCNREEGERQKRQELTDPLFKIAGRMLKIEQKSIMNINRIL